LSFVTTTTTTTHGASVPTVRAVQTAMTLPAMAVFRYNLKTKWPPLENKREKREGRRRLMNRWTTFPRVVYSINTYPRRLAQFYPRTDAGKRSKNT